jgi:hypothetical protein
MASAAKTAGRIRRAVRSLGTLDADLGSGTRLTDKEAEELLALLLALLGACERFSTAADCVHARLLAASAPSNGRSLDVQDTAA